MNEIVIPTKKLHEDAKLPTKSHFDDAGWDLYALEDQWILPFCTTKIRTGISMAIPRGYVGLICDRSGMAINKCVHRVAGVMDSPYRGEWIVGVFRFFPWPIKIDKGDRIAQFLVQEIPLHVTFEETDELSTTERGDGGLGSTGK